jgi:HEAT repeat protein
VPEDLQVASDSDLPTEVRRQALGRLSDVEHTPEVIEKARSAETPARERWVAVRALGHNVSPEAGATLLDLLGAKETPTRIAAIGALGDRGNRDVTPRLASLLADPAILVRHAAADALGKLKATDAVHDLGRAISDPSNHYRGQSLWVRKHFVSALGDIGSHDAAPYLRTALDDGDADVVQAALAALEKLAGFSYREGRTPEEEKEAWRRWAGK